MQLDKISLTLSNVAKLCLFLLLFIPTLAFAKKKSPLIPTRLQVEYLQAPIGIDIKKPRFSWVLETKKEDVFAKKQKAYRILVASAEKKLHQDVSDIWDSGWIPSSAMNQILYEGKALISDRSYYWKVSVKDEKGLVSDWSDVAHWSSGLFDPNEWEAEWIGGDEVFDPTQRDCNIWDPWLRQVFEISQKPQQANLYVASIGFHEVYVNGKRIGEEVMAPVVSDHTKRARYVVYDIAPYLTKGKNVIGIWLGTSWSIFAGYDIDGSRPMLPLVSAQMKIYGEGTLNDNSQPIHTLLTDSSWKIKQSPNKLLGVWDFGQMGGELWDDRKREDNWNTLLYDDSHWDAVSVYPLNLIFSAQNVMGNRRKAEIRPIAIEEKADGTYRVDMGVNFAGWTEVKMKGEPGDTIRFYYSEREQQEMTFNMRSMFIMGQQGTGIFKNRFNYSSGRWITIKGLRNKPTLADIKGWLVRTDYADAGNFECSDSLQNWMYNKIKWTYENLSLGGFIVDCPQRERMGYGGDAHATSETGILNYQLGAFYTKWMQDWRDVQGTEPMVGNMRDKNYARKGVTSGRIFNNGILPHTAPTYWGGGGPAWGGIVVTLPWFMYQHYGDKNALVENYGLIKNWLEFLDSNVEEDLMKRFGGTWDFLGDWLWPNATAEGMNNDKPETLCLNNAYRVFNLRTAAKIAHVIGDDSQARNWEEKANRASTAINNKFYNKEKGIYADGSMANLAAALLADVVPPAEKRKVIKSLENEILINRNGHIHSGITGGALLFKWLRNEGRNDLIYSMTSQTSYPSWGFMKDNGATTIWEMWEKDLPGHSLLHSSYLYPGAWYMDGLAGIKLEKPGYAQFIIEPPIAGEANIKWVKASFDSPVGLIKHHWKRENGKLTLSLVVPPNTSCLLKLSAIDAVNIVEREGVIAKLPTEEGKIVYELQSGNYSF